MKPILLPFISSRTAVGTNVSFAFATEKQLMFTIRQSSAPITPTVYLREPPREIRGLYLMTVVLNHPPLQLLLLIIQQVSMEICLTIVICDWICENVHRIILTNPVPNAY